MTLDLTGKKVVVISGKQSVGHAIAEAVARKGADVVIWLRKCNDELNEAKVLPMTQLEIPSQRPNSAAPIALTIWPLSFSTRQSSEGLGRPAIG
jgi:NAD(P)-dependent dehydrogenase (short-subunit alcohol dehydrogenase family)